MARRKRSRLRAGSNRSPEHHKLISSMVALGRPGKPDDIGRMIASLLSDDNHWINAQRIEVSGGQLI
jgi:NAD(P)-dependent dehydrogenase (short-subunit alcohol dehydrogenase family)